MELGLATLGSYTHVTVIGWVVATSLRLGVCPSIHSVPVWPLHSLLVLAWPLQASEFEISDTHHHPFTSLRILGNFNWVGNKNGCLVRTCPGNRVLFVLDPTLGWICKRRIPGPNSAEWMILFPQCRAQHLIWAYLSKCVCKYPARWWVMDMFKMGSGNTRPNNFLFFFLLPQETVFFPVDCLGGFSSSFGPWRPHWRCGSETSQQERMEHKPCPMVISVWFGVISSGVLGLFPK